MKRLLIVDLLAERQAFGEKGCEEIIRHFPGYDVFLWSPHIENPRKYPFGTRVKQPLETDVIVITGSRKNVTSWEPWMDAVVSLIQNSKAEILGICFGHQIICAAFGGRIERDDMNHAFMAEVTYQNGTKVNQLFTHQEFVTNSGEMEVIASTEHCNIAACRHPTRPIRSVQFHPEAVKNVLDYALQCGDMSEQERRSFGNADQDLDVASALIDAEAMGD
jgi:GMP synthase-like glutamine amidotransferase